MVTGAAFAPPAPPEPVVSHLTGEARRPARVVARSLTQEAAPRLQGVDLRLDSFDLSSTTRVSQEAQSWNAEAKSLDECRTVGVAFWDCLEDGLSNFPEGDRDLLKEIFNPELSDRRCEGDMFLPPDASYSSVARLRALVKEEEKIRQRRKEHFFSKDFSMSDPGPLFPASWTPSCEVTQGQVPVQVPEGRQQGTLQARPDLKEVAAVLLRHILKTSAPIFDRITEEGLRFLIYRLGSLEVRTTQDLDGEETTGAVFSIRPSVVMADSDKRGPVRALQKVTKATEYVERICVVTNNGPSFSCHYFIVLEIENDHRIVAELCDGKVEWNEDDANLDDRCSLAKVTRSERCVGINVREMRTFKSCVANEFPQSGKSSASVRKRFAKRLFNMATTQNKP
jgi:hypothetical protein